jgi:CMP-N-acetylneuraminic acid synthetase
MVNKPICIIPARGGSKRLPRKNIALLAGKPLLAYAIEAAIDSDIFDQVCVSSDDDEILETARIHGAHIAQKRMEDLATDTAQVKHVCVDLLNDFTAKGMEYTEFAVLLTTNPLRTARDIKSAHEIFKSEDANYVMSFVPYTHPPQRAVKATHGYIEPYFGIKYMKPTQSLDTLYRHDGSIIFAKTNVFLKEKEFYGTKVVPYFMPVERSVDIDTPMDLTWAEFLLSHLGTDHESKVRAK